MIKVLPIWNYPFLTMENVFYDYDATNKPVQPEYVKIDNATGYTTDALYATSAPEIKSVELGSEIIDVLLSMSSFTFVSPTTLKLKDISQLVFLDTVTSKKYVYTVVSISSPNAMSVKFRCAFNVVASYIKEIADIKAPIERYHRDIANPKNYIREDSLLPKPQTVNESYPMTIGVKNKDALSRTYTTGLWSYFYISLNEEDRKIHDGWENPVSPVPGQAGSKFRGHLKNEVGSGLFGSEQYVVIAYPMDAKGTVSEKGANATTYEKLSSYPLTQKIVNSPIPPFGNFEINSDIISAVIKTGLYDTKTECEIVVPTTDKQYSELPLIKAPTYKSIQYHTSKSNVLIVPTIYANPDSPIANMSPILPYSLTKWLVGEWASEVPSDEIEQLIVVKNNWSELDSPDLKFITGSGLISDEGHKLVRPAPKVPLDLTNLNLNIIQGEIGFAFDEKQPIDWKMLTPLFTGQVLYGYQYDFTARIIHCLAESKEVIQNKNSKVRELRVERKNELTSDIITDEYKNFNFLNKNSIRARERSERIQAGLGIVSGLVGAVAGPLGKSPIAGVYGGIQLGSSIASAFTNADKRKSEMADLRSANTTFKGSNFNSNDDYLNYLPTVNFRGTSILTNNNYANHSVYNNEDPYFYDTVYKYGFNTEGIRMELKDCFTMASYNFILMGAVDQVIAKDIPNHHLRRIVDRINLGVGFHKLGFNYGDTNTIKGGVVYPEPDLLYTFDQSNGNTADEYTGDLTPYSYVSITAWGDSGFYTYDFTVQGSTVKKIVGGPEEVFYMPDTNYMEDILLYKRTTIPAMSTLTMGGTDPILDRKIWKMYGHYDPLT